MKIVPDIGTVENASPRAMFPRINVSGGRGAEAARQGSSWILTVYQTPITRTANGIDFADSFLETALSFSDLNDVITPCVSTIVHGLLASKPVASWATELSVAAAWKELSDDLSDTGTWTGVGSAAFNCATEQLPNLVGASQQNLKALLAKNSASTFGARFAPFLNRTKLLADKYAQKLVRPYKVAKTIYDLTEFGSKAYFIYAYWASSTPTGVCEGNDPSSGTLGVVNCAASLSLDHTPLTLDIGQKFKYTVTAKDKNGTNTIAPAGLIWSSSDPNYVGVDQSGTISAINNLPYAAIIKVVDPATGAQGTAGVYVGSVTAMINATPTSIDLGGSATLSWSSQNATSCQPTGEWSGSIATSGSLAITPGSAGMHTYGITYTDIRGTASVSTSLTVNTPINMPSSNICTPGQEVVFYASDPSNVCKIYVPLVAVPGGGPGHPYFLAYTASSDNTIAFVPLYEFTIENGNVYFSIYKGGVFGDATVYLDYADNYSGYPDVLVKVITVHNR